MWNTVSILNLLAWLSIFCSHLLNMHEKIEMEGEVTEHASLCRTEFNISNRILMKSEKMPIAKARGKQMEADEHQEAPSTITTQWLKHQPRSDSSCILNTHMTAGMWQRWCKDRKGMAGEGERGSWCIMDSNSDWIPNMWPFVLYKGKRNWNVQPGNRTQHFLY